MCCQDRQSLSKSLCSEISLRKGFPWTKKVSRSLTVPFHGQATKKPPVSYLHGTKAVRPFSPLSQADKCKGSLPCTRNHLTAAWPLPGRCHPPSELASAQTASPVAPDTSLAKAMPSRRHQSDAMFRGMPSQRLPTEKWASSLQAVHGVTPKMNIKGPSRHGTLMHKSLLPSSPLLWTLYNQQISASTRSTWHLPIPSQVAQSPLSPKSPISTFWKTCPFVTLVLTASPSRKQIFLMGANNQKLYKGGRSVPVHWLNLSRSQCLCLK